MTALHGGLLKVQDDGSMQFGSSGPAAHLAIDTLTSALLDDPMTQHWSRRSDAARRAFCNIYIRGGLSDREPRLNFLSKGGGGAVVAALVPQQQEHGAFIHVVALGTRPEAQGKGVGSQLLRRILAHADEHSLPVYLEASTERSRQLYLRHGFHDLETWHGGFPLFLMWRPARGGPTASAEGGPAAGRRGAISRCWPVSREGFYSCSGLPSRSGRRRFARP